MLKKLLIVPAALLAFLLGTVPAQAHEGGHQPVPESAAMQIAANVAGKLADKDRGMGFGQLDKSWKLIPPAAVSVKKRGQGYYIVEVFNLKEKRTLSVLMSEAGEVYDANFTGAFPGLTD